MKPPILLKMTSPLGEGFEIPYHDFGPSTDTPAIAFVGGIHGNELNSVFILARLAAYLAPIAAGKKEGQKLLGRVVLIPAVNVIGMHTRDRQWPFDRTDINRMFPGYHLGETTQRIADAVFQKTKTAMTRIDIHASNLEIEELPQVRIYDTHPGTLASAKQFGLPAVIQCPVNKTAIATLLNAWMTLGGENFVIQAGMAGDLQVAACERVLKAFVRFLIQKNILSSTLESVEADAGAIEETTHTFGLQHTVSVVSEKAGLFVAQAILGRWMEQGDLLGVVYDGFDGRIRARIRAPISGLLTAMRRQALIYQGDLLARLQSRTPIAKGADTYLLGQGQ